MAEWTKVFDQKAGAGDADMRLDAPSFHRNHRPIAETLKTVLTNGAGDVVEIGSGTGQHIAAFAGGFPDLVWWPTDYHDSHVASIEAWRRHAGLVNIMPPCLLDAASANWRFSGPSAPALGALRAIICINVFHISPWNVTEGVLRGAGKYLRDGGHLIVYGPFKRDGRHTADSNMRFDRSLREQDHDWGIRDVGDVADCADGFGLRLDAVHEMPNNNLSLVFCKGGSVAGDR